MLRRLASPAGALATFGLGALLMIVFDDTAARIAGVVLLATGIALGVLAIATDDFIAGGD